MSNACVALTINTDFHVYIAFCLSNREKEKKKERNDSLRVIYIFHRFEDFRIIALPDSFRSIHG